MNKNGKMSPIVIVGLIIFGLIALVAIINAFPSPAELFRLLCFIAIVSVVAYILGRKRIRNFMKAYMESGAMSTYFFMFILVGAMILLFILSLIQYGGNWRNDPFWESKESTTSADYSPN